MSIQSMWWKPVIVNFMNSKYSISICLTKALTTICLSSMLSISSTRAIAFLVDLSIQYAVDL